jgi:hypothetical protein
VSRGARGVGIAIGLGLGLGIGCGKERASSAPAGEVAAPAVAAAAAGCSLGVMPDRLPAAARLVAIGDLHGDLAATRAALRAAALIDQADRWSAGDTVVVQTGDVLDRGDDEPEILALIARLEGEAAAAGGAFVALNGNHELMNAAGELGYVTRDGFADYATCGVSPNRRCGGRHVADGVTPGEGGRRVADGVTPGEGELDGVPAFARGRLAAFRPGGPVARELAGRRVVVVVGDTVFAHAGPSAGDDLAAINRAARCWLAGQGPEPAVVADPEGPVWTRAYGGEAPDCDRLAAALASLGARRMVVGHTVQPGGANAACDGRLWRIDVGMAAAYGGPIEVLELVGDRATVLRGSR